MAQKDKDKWNKKYNNTPELLEDREASKKLIEVIEKIKGKKALDIACGGGRNSIYLANKGFEVDAVDISEVALETLDKKNIPNITTKIVDLDNFIPEKNSYDLIIMTNFLDRELIPHLIDALKKDGVIFIETYMFHEENEKPPSNPSFLLEKDELKTFCSQYLELLDYDEFFNEKYELYKMRKQSIAAKKLVS